jgi:flavin-dependent dehydrogenase
VISNAEAALGGDARSLAAAVAAQLRADLDLPEPMATAVLAEKRATIVPAPGLRRPPARLPAPSLYLAGDAAASAYPSTLEGSVRAGIAAAAALVADRQPG